jgi:alpha-beta hydrolase superfamily lysophospholipase
VITTAIERIKTAEYAFNEPKSDLQSEVNTYLDYYGLPRGMADHTYGYLDIKGEKIFLQSFNPEEPIADVLVVHGYFDHTGSMSHLIHSLLKARCRVWSYDLTGHGLSSGERAAIEDFSDYLSVFKEVSGYVTADSLPAYVIAHSTGAAIVLDHLLHFRSSFEKTILLAPLVRSYRWKLSVLGRMISPAFFQTAKRVYRKNTSLAGFQKKVIEDPLQHNRLSLSWVDALISWNKKVHVKGPCKEKLLIIQGDLDRTVDWKYNCRFINYKFPSANIILVNEADHQLMNETSEVRELVFYLINNYIGSNKDH